MSEPAENPTAERLFQVWNEERGRNARPLNPDEKTQMVRALVARYEDRMNRKPLMHCDICGVQARGAHRV